MATPNERFGDDVRLLRDLQNQNSRSPGNDLVTVVRPQTGGIDLDRVTAVDDLRQALLLRFLTRVGELANLGHPDYGSRLFDLIGELNNDRNRNKAKLYVLQALAAEPRIQEVVSVTVKTHPGVPDRIDIDVSAIPIGSDTPLNLVFPFFLQGVPGP